MNRLDDPFGYRQLPEWSPMKSIEVAAKPVARWQSIAAGVGGCLGLVFLAQLLLAIASHDLRGYRARSIDTASAASTLGALVAGVVIWRRLR